LRTSIRLLLVLAAVALAALFIAYHQSGREDATAIRQAVEQGLAGVYPRLTAAAPKETNVATLTSELVVRVLQAELSQERSFPGFTKADTIWVSRNSVVPGATNLLFVVHSWGDAMYGLEGSGQPRRVGEAEFKTWPHLALPNRSPQ
jgi:hypothetical protein